MVKKAPPRNDWVDLNEVIIEVFALAQREARRNRVYMKRQLKSDLPMVHGDRVQLQQVILNLIINGLEAIAKSNDATRELIITSGVDGKDNVIVAVKDSGEGIPAEMLPTVFDLFVQSRQAVDRSQGGLGLGLTIVRTMVELHGGSVEARSDGVGRGSAFVIRLPAAQASAPPKVQRRSARRAARGPAIRALIVDDNHDAAAMLADALKTFGYEVRTAADGPAALALAAQFQPQVALLDLGLPVMDGYEVSERMQTLSTPIVTVAVTGYGQEADRSRSAAAGFAAHFVKPVDIDELKATLDGLLTPASVSRV